MDHLRVTLCLCSCLCFKTSSRDKHEFDLLENRHVSRTHSHMNGFARRLFSTQRQKKWKSVWFWMEMNVRDETGLFQNSGKMNATASFKITWSYFINCTVFSFALSCVKLQRIIIITVYTGAGGKRNEIRSCLDNVIIHRHFCSDFNNLLSSKRCDFASVNSARVEFEDKLSGIEI